MAYYNIKNFRRTLPVASHETLGCIKSGGDLEIDSAGIATVVGGGEPPELPVATSETLGCIKSGGDLEIDSAGIATVVGGGEPPESPTLNNLEKIISSVHFNESIKGFSGANLVSPFLNDWNIVKGEFINTLPGDTLSKQYIKLQPMGFMKYSNPLDVYDSNLEPNYNIKIKYSIHEDDMVSDSERYVYFSVIYDEHYNQNVTQNIYYSGTTHELIDGYYTWEINEDFFLTKESDQTTKADLTKIKEIVIQFDIFGDSPNPHILIEEVLLKPLTCTSDNKELSLGIGVFE